MQAFDWPSFLRQWNAELLTSRLIAEVREHFPSDDLERAVQAGWLGYPGATEAQLLDAEVRLGKRLPPSYRAFLSVSNGWRLPGYFVPKLWAVEEIAWLAVSHRESIDAWMEGEQYSHQGEPLRVPDDRYFLYGAEQYEYDIRSEYLETALDISDVEIAGTAMYLLNPQVQHDHEWEAWLWAHWLPGARRYRSFQEMLEGEYRVFRSVEAS